MLTGRVISRSERDAFRIEEREQGRAVLVLDLWRSPEGETGIKIEDHRSGDLEPDGTSIILEKHFAAALAAFVSTPFLAGDLQARIEGQRLPPRQVWMAQLRTLMRGASRVGASPEDVECAHRAIEELEARVLLAARYHASRSVELLALLLQDSQDADGKLSELHASVRNLARDQLALLDEALQHRGVELGVDP